MSHHMLTNLNVIEPSFEHRKELCNLLIESISVNCASDYNNDPQVMAEWLANKTPENMALWIGDKNNISFAIFDVTSDKIASFLLMNREGDILLNYVRPSYIYKGIGKALLKEAEHSARLSGIKNLSVISTITAKKFYERNGFVKNGEPEYVGSIPGDFPLIKYLIAVQ